MAHEIDQTVDKQGAAMFAGNPAWHGLGHVVESAQTSADALRIAGLDWEVEKVPLKAVLESGEIVDCKSNFAIRRKDVAGENSILGVVGAQYKPLQNWEAFDWFDEIVGQKLAHWETAGSLRGGRQVWCMAKLPGGYEVGNNDFVQPYVAITTAHDGTEAIRLWPTTVRIVCNNTLRASIGASGNCGLALRHYETSLAGRVEKAKELIAGIRTAHDLRAEESLAMKATTVDFETVESYFEEIINLTGLKSEKSKDKARAILDELFSGSKNAGGYGANVWTLYNAASEWSDWGRGRKYSGETRFASNIFGVGHSFKTRAWEEAKKLIAV